MDRARRVPARRGDVVPDDDAAVLDRVADVGGERCAHRERVEGVSVSGDTYVRAAVAKALRKAASDLCPEDGFKAEPLMRLPAVFRWLMDRADRIERGLPPEEPRLMDTLFGRHDAGGLRRSK